MTFPPLAPLPGDGGTRFRIVSAPRPTVVTNHGSVEAEDQGAFWEAFVEGAGHGDLYHWTTDGAPLVDPYALSMRDGRCVVVAPPPPFVWDRPEITLSESVIYELHVRGYTKTRGGGTYAALTERIDYLRGLGVTAVELLPVHEFSTLDDGHPNFWGYSPIAWFAPHSGYATGDPIAEFREMVRAFHAAGIQVLIDAVFNHTAELGADGPTLHFKALDPGRYYIDEERTGCGNTVDATDPAVRSLVVDCLRWWHGTLGVDGFRFDLASVLSRSPTLIERIETDPQLLDAHLIAEAWDAAGTYEVASWPGGPRWAVWNDRFRDDVRKAWSHAPTRDVTKTLATRLCGSSDLFDTSPSRSVNYVACHDGLTLRDLDIDRRNLMASLLLARGVPMLLGGDEFGRTQGGNHNAYDQDNETSWVDWSFPEKDASFFDFVRTLLRLRREVPALREDRFLTDDDVRWFSPHAPEAGVDWESGAFGFEVHGDVIVVVNLTDESTGYAPPDGWRIAVDTGAPGILAACPPSPPS